MGAMECLAILALVVLLFGASALPKLAKSAGDSVGIFKKALKNGEENAEEKETVEEK